MSKLGFHTHMQQRLDLHVYLFPLLPRTHTPHRLVLMWMQSWWMAEILCTMLQTMDMQTCWSTSSWRELRLMWGWREGGKRESRRGGRDQAYLLVCSESWYVIWSEPTTPPWECFIIVGQAWVTSCWSREFYSLCTQVVVANSFYMHTMQPFV